MGSKKKVKKTSAKKFNKEVKSAVEKIVKDSSIGFSKEQQLSNGKKKKNV